MVAATVAAAALTPARFAPRPGWHTGAGQIHACPGVSPTRCRQAGSWAATVPWRDCVECLPHRTIALLPADGIAVQITVAEDHPPTAAPELRRPLRVSQHDVGGLEGVPAKNGVVQRSARIGRLEVYVFVFFGRRRPTAPQLAAANTELRAAKLP